LRYFSSLSTERPYHLSVRRQTEPAIHSDYRHGPHGFPYDISVAMDCLDAMRIRTTLLDPIIAIHHTST
jgi:hypothetical protein